MWRKRDIARAMRRTPTPSEALAWDLLRGRRLRGLKFRRQQPIEGFVADFYCAELRLALEIDGESHANPAAQARDIERDNILASKGVRVLRIRASDVSEAALSRMLDDHLDR